MWKVGPVMDVAGGGYGFNVTTDRNLPLVLFAYERSDRDEVLQRGCCTVARSCNRPPDAPRNLGCCMAMQQCNSSRVVFS
jgi:hypothetical protein